MWRNFLDGTLALKSAGTWDESEHPRQPAGSDKGGEFAPKGARLNVKTQAFQKWFGNSKIVGADGNPLQVYHGTNSEFSAFNPHYIGATDDGFYGTGFYFTPNAEEATEYGTIVMPVYLAMQKPFRIPSSGDAKHLSLYDLRDDLSKLDGIKLPPTKRTLPDGYTIEKVREYVPAYDKEMTFYRVMPSPKYYGTDKEIYGNNALHPLQAIVEFNDELDGHNYSSDWWASDVLKSANRKNLSSVLKRNGYDGVIVYDPNTNSDTEYIVFSPNQIKSTFNAGTWNSGNMDVLKSLILKSERTWDESRVNRQPAGAPEGKGGEFARNDGANVARDWKPPRNYRTEIQGYLNDGVAPEEIVKRITKDFQMSPQAAKLILAAEYAKWKLAGEKKENPNNPPMAVVTSIPKRKWLSQSDMIRTLTEEGLSNDKIAAELKTQYSFLTLESALEQVVYEQKRWQKEKEKKELEGRVIPDGGTDVSAAIQVDKLPKAMNSLKETLGAIDQVHGDGNLKTIPLVTSAGTVTRGSFVTDNGGAREIKISRKGGHPDLTLVHEMGHYVDFGGLGVTNAYGAKLFASEFDRSPEMEQWRAAIASSKSVNELLVLAKQPKRSIKVELPDGSVHEQTIVTDRKYVGYLLSNRELWARAYAQYIATRSKNPKLLGQLKEQQHLIEKNTLSYPQQWSDEDFVPIAKAMDAVFAARGWLRVPQEATKRWMQKTNRSAQNESNSVWKSWAWTSLPRTKLTTSKRAYRPVMW